MMTTISTHNCGDLTLPYASSYPADIATPHKYRSSPVTPTATSPPAGTLTRSNNTAPRHVTLPTPLALLWDHSPSSRTSGILGPFSGSFPSGRSNRVDDWKRGSCYSSTDKR
jgi:hypothetical protein